MTTATDAPATNERSRAWEIRGTRDANAGERSRSWRVVRSLFARGVPGETVARERDPVGAGVDVEGVGAEEAD